MIKYGRLLSGAGIALVLTGLMAPTVMGHHSFAMYDTTTVKVFTGVVSRIDPAPNHLQIFFAPMLEDRKNVERNAQNQPIIWSVEMEGSAQMARQGVSVNSFPAGTVFSVALHPVRNGDPAGVRIGGLFKCPERTPPPAGKHCDSVEGHVQIGREPLGTAQEGKKD